MESQQFFFFRGSVGMASWGLQVCSWMAPMLRKSGRPAAWVLSLDGWVKARFRLSWRILENINQHQVGTQKTRCFKHFPRNSPPPNPFVRHFFCTILSFKKLPSFLQSFERGKALLFESGGPDTEYVIREAAPKGVPPSFLSRGLGWNARWPNAWEQPWKRPRRVSGIPGCLVFFFFAAAFTFIFFVAAFFCGLVFFFLEVHNFFFPDFSGKAQFLGLQMLVMNCMICRQRIIEWKLWTFSPLTSRAMEHLGWTAKLWNKERRWENVKTVESKEPQICEIGKDLEIFSSCSRKKPIVACEVFLFAVHIGQSFPLRSGLRLACVKRFRRWFKLERRADKIPPSYLLFASSWCHIWVFPKIGVSPNHPFQ